MSKRLPAAAALLFATGMLAVTDAPARADGCHFSRREIARVARIPAQRAVIAFRLGVETLVVESGVDSESRELGWVIPLPAVPTTIRPTSPGMLETLSSVLQARVVDDLAGLLVFSGMATYLGLGFACWASGRKEVRSLVVVGLIVCCLPFCMLGSLGSPRGGRVPDPSDPPGVEVARREQIGSYDVAVLRAEDAEALSRWLDQHDFMALDERARGIAADYVRQGWCFTAARLIRKGAGLATPHPLRVAFPVAAPVYPMRLTALGGSTPRVELFVITEETATHPLLVREFSDRFETVSELPTDLPTDLRFATFRATKYGPHVSHPGLYDLMWNGCVVTRLSGSLRPEDMLDDLRFALEPFAPTRRILFSPRGAAQLGAGAGLFLFGAALLGYALLLAIGRRRRRPSDGTALAPEPGRAVGRQILLRLVSAAAIGGILFLCCPTVEVERSRPVHRSIARMHVNMLSDLVDRKILDAGDPAEDWIAAATGAWTKTYSQPLPRFGDGPGEIQLRVEGGRWVAYRYDDSGRPTREPLGQE